MGPSVIRRMKIVNERGLHARASGTLSQLCETFQSEAVVRFNGDKADPRSIMDLLTLAAAKGSEIEVEATGADALAMVDAMEAMIAGKFGESR